MGEVRKLEVVVSWRVMIGIMEGEAILNKKKNAHSRKLNPEFFFAGAGGSGSACTSGSVASCCAGSGSAWFVSCVPPISISVELWFAVAVAVAVALGSGCVDSVSPGTRTWGVCGVSIVQWNTGSMDSMGWVGRER